MAPLVVRGRCSSATAAASSASAGWLDGARRGDRQGRLDAPTAPGPDADCLIGPSFKPFYQQDGARTWASRPGRRTTGRSAAATSGAGSRYDPELNLIYYGTGNPGVVEPRAAARRQQVDLRHLRPRPGHRRGRLVLPVEPARPVRPRRHQREHPARPAARRAASRARSSSTPSATATSTSSTARPARCSRPRRSSASPRARAST